MKPDKVQKYHVDGPQGFFLLCKSLKTSSRLIVTRFVYTSKFEILIPFIITYMSQHASKAFTYKLTKY